MNSIVLYLKVFYNPYKQKTKQFDYLENKFLCFQDETWTKMYSVESGSGFNVRFRFSFTPVILIRSFLGDVEHFTCL